MDTCVSMGLSIWQCVLRLCIRINVYSTVSICVNSLYVRESSVHMTVYLGTLYLGGHVDRW